jgi:hypothetical protein
MRPIYHDACPDKIFCAFYECYTPDFPRNFDVFLSVLLTAALFGVQFV